MQHKGKYFYWVILIIYIFISNGCNENSNVKMVKGGVLESCPNKTVEQMVNGFMENPSWQNIISEDKKEYVNISGGVTYLDKPVNALVQFEINSGAGSFQLKGFELNGVPQNELVAFQLLTQMCSNSEANPVEENQEETKKLPENDPEIDLIMNNITGKCGERYILSKKHDLTNSNSGLYWTFLEIKNLNYKADDFELNEADIANGFERAGNILVYGDIYRNATYVIEDTDFADTRGWTKWKLQKQRKDGDNYITWLRFQKKNGRIDLLDGAEYYEKSPCESITQAIDSLPINEYDL